MKEKNIGFLSATDLTAPAFFQEDEAKGFARCFYGGFLTTCGLTYMGSYCTDEGKALGQHGLTSNVLANHVGSAVRWEGDTPSIQVSGQIKQAQVFGEHLVMWSGTCSP